MYRTRQLIKHLLYPRLIDDGIVPVLFEEDINELSKQRHLVCVSRNKLFSEFGIFMEELIKERIKDKENIFTFNYFRYLLNQCGLGEIEDKQIPNIMKFCKDKVTCIYEKLKNRKCKFEEEFSLEEIQGHPDIITKRTIYDVKTTFCFQTTKQTKDIRKNEMYNTTCLQLLTYYTLSKMSGQTPKSVGVILPMQKTILTENISDWDYMDFYSVLCSTAQMLESSKLTMSPTFTMDYMMRYNTLLVGHHISKQGGLANRIEEWSKMKNAPFQIYLRPNQGTFRKVTVTQDAVNKIKASLTSTCRMFVHGALDINIAKTFYDMETFTNDLDICNKVGGEGVVIHVGKNKEEPYKTCLKNMKRNIRSVIRNNASSFCPLMLETPAGQGTEMLCSVKQFGEFYNSFKDYQKEKFKICVDTCHVFSAGYNPFQYILQLENIVGKGVIHLIHFNNSMVPCGQCNDRHSNPTGHIDLKSMLNVMEYAESNGIPLVVE